MGNFNIHFEENATKVVGLARFIARSERGNRLDAVHLFKAAILAYPEEVALCIRQTGGTWSDAMFDSVTAPEGLQVQTDPISITHELVTTVRRLGQNSQTVTLGDLLRAILRAPSVRVESLLNKAQATDPAAAHKGNKGHTRPLPYASRRDWLTDLHTEWLLRKKAVHAKGLSGDYYEGHKTYEAATVLDAVACICAANRCRAEITPATFDPLASLANDLDQMQRHVCECVAVDEIYGLSDHGLGGLPVRVIAQMLSPETYPGNCRKVLDAVDRLKERGVVAWIEHGEPIHLTGRVRLTDGALGQLLADLDGDAISAGELCDMKRRIRLGADWGTACDE